MARDDSRSAVDHEGFVKVQCLECPEPEVRFFHRLDVHLTTVHKMSTGEYLEKFPGAETLSARAAGIAARPGAPKAAKAAPEAVAAEASILRLGSARVRVREGVGPADRQWVPEHDEQWDVASCAEAWEALGLAVSEREPALLVGPTGSGKSAAVLELAAVLDQPVRRVNLHGDVRAADFLGEKVVEVDAASGQAVVAWRDGVLPQALRAGHWLLVDELDAAPPQILFVLQGLLERGGALTLTGNGGEVVRPHPDFRLIATANTLGRGDDSGLYAGTCVLNEAFLDRFGVVCTVGYMKAAQEVDVLVSKTGVDRGVAAKMVEVAGKVREAFLADECNCTFSTRRLLSWARKAHMMKDARRAARLAALNKLGRDDQTFVADVMQRAFGGEVQR